MSTVLTPLTNDDDKRLAGGHKIHRMIVQTFRPWCGICKQPVPWFGPTTADEAPWLGTSAEAYTALQDHLALHMPSET